LEDFDISLFSSLPPTLTLWRWEGVREIERVREPRAQNAEMRDGRLGRWGHGRNRWMGYERESERYIDRDNKQEMEY
jgi:hypothetical protein